MFLLYIYMQLGGGGGQERGSGVTLSEAGEGRMCEMVWMGREWGCEREMWRVKYP